MTRQLSPDELDLDRSEMSEEDWKARLEQLESDPDQALEILEGLSDAQRRALRFAVGRGGQTHSGRGGWNVRIMQALEKKSLVLKGKEYTWDTNWSLTTRGRAVALIAQKQYLESFKK